MLFPHLARWAVEHRELILLLGVPTVAWAAVATDPGHTVADVTRRRDG